MQRIFDHQRELMHKYHPIEQSLGYSPPDPHSLPISLTSRHNQDRLRQFAWWITEECVEAYAATAQPKQYSEELSDVLHFMVEFCLLSGVPVPSLEDIKAIRVMEIYPPNPQVFDVVVQVGLAVNMLKAKPWKQTPKATDPELFRAQAMRALHLLVHLILNLGLDPNEIYFHKNEINQKRIQEGY